MQKRNFTLIELLVVIGILFILTAIAVPTFRFFQKESDLNNSVELIINTLRLAQNKTIASEGASQWGVYFSTGTLPHQYTLFQGEEYISRTTSSDEVHKLPKNIEIYEISLAEGGAEIVFDRVLGTTLQFGNLSLRIKTDPTKTSTIYIENSGQIGITSPQTPSDEERIKDSRHVHFDYTRTIATSTENLILTFEGPVTETIIIADNMKNGQIYWEGEIEIGGEIQQLKIHTHRLNDFVLGTQFCIHRDRRYNNKILNIELSGDVSGFLLNYSADGLTTSKTSIYASEPIWQ